MGTITLLLHQARTGHERAMDELFRRVYDDLRQMARRQIAATRGTPNLDATSLVNAACERLLGADKLDAEDRGHFFFVLGRAMHDVLVEEARSDLAKKRGGGRSRVPLADFQVDGRSLTLRLPDLHQALEELKQRDPEGAQVVMLRFFGGRTLEEAADLMGCTFAVARRHWEYSKAWLHERLSEERTDPVEGKQS
jgi:RNA polymerase sigma factor (TIGR02999 family)